MKSFKKITFILLVVCIFTLLFSNVISYAEEAVIEPRTVDSDLSAVTTSEDSEGTAVPSTIDHLEDLYLQDKSVTVDYPVQANVFVLANDVTIDSSILGNAFICAKTVNIKSNAYINSSLFVLAEDVNIDGVVFDLYSASSNLSISSNARILRNITAGGNTLDLSGAIYRNANLGFDTINVSENASISGNLKYYSNAESIPEEIVGGSFTFNEVSSEETSSVSVVSEYLKNLLHVLVISLIVVLIIIFAMPKFAEKEQKILENKSIVSIGYGAIAIIAIPIACFILFCTVLGILPALSILFTYLFLIIEIASALVAIPLAKIICKKINKDTKSMNILISMALVLVIWLLEQIPVLGNIISLLVSILALGLIAYAILHSKIEEKNKNVVAQASIVVDAKDDNK